MTESGAVPIHDLIPWTPFIPHRPTDQQLTFLATGVLLGSQYPDEASEVLYGGAAGGGKSDALLMGALQYVDVPGYAALILRRTYADLALPGAIMARSKEWLKTTPARWNNNDKTWTFPSGATLTFGYLQHADDVYRYQSAEFQYCVALGTPILMADGSWRPIETIREGDLVDTLEGPRPVTATHSPGVKPLARVQTHYGDTLVSEQHRILTANGWVAPNELQPTRSHEHDSTPEASQQTSRRHAEPCESRRSGHWPAPERVPLHPAGTRRQEIDASRAARGTGSEVSDDGLQEARRLHESSVLVALHVPAMWSASPALAPDSRWRDPDHDSLAFAPPGWPLDCRASRGSGDAPPRAVPVAGRAHTPSRGDAEGPSPLPTLEGDRASTPWRDPWDGRTYFHPYTTEHRPRSVDVRFSSARIDRAGEGEVRDLTVAGASHYVAWPGIISSNCAFDELTQFSEKQYTYLFSRVRRPEGSNIPLRLRAATNPGGVGHVWVKRRFPVDRTHEDGEPYFISAKLDDNPHLDQAAYAASLNHLDPVTRDRLLKGDWGVFEGAAFPMFDTDTHVVDAPAELPEWWERFESMDYGSVHPTCWLMYGIDQYGNVLVADEYYGPGLVQDHAGEVLKRRAAWWSSKDEKGWARSHPCYAPADIRAKRGHTHDTGREMTVESDFLEHGVAFSPAQMNRQGGCTRIREMLSAHRSTLDGRPGRVFPEWHPKSGEEGSPRLFVSSRCVETIGQLMAAPVEDVGQLRGEAIKALWETDYGHATAALRYGTLTRFPSAVVPVPVIEDPRARALAEHEARLAEAMA